MIAQSRQAAVQIIQYVVLILIDGFALMVLAAVWSVRKDAIQRDFRRLAAWLRRKSS